MSFSHGKDLSFSIGDVSDVSTADDISEFVTKVSLPRSADTAEVSTAGSASKSYVAGMKDGTISFEGKWDPDIDSRLDGVLGLDGLAFSYTPQVGGPTYTGVGILTSYEVDSDIGDALTLSAELQISGDVGRA